MLDLVTLVKAFGPIMGLTLFMIWKQLQIGSISPKFEAIEDRLDTIIEKLDRNAKQFFEFDD